ncbi:MAG: peptidase Ste24p [Flavipsychrobacter sp.]|jgi:predicted Zn-dependent protease|nr:peptidase Ste24p [Flavipsychrobacter sp.]
MRKLIACLSILAFVATGMVMYSCKKNASGRNTLSLVDDATVLSLSSQEYSKFMTSNPPVTGTPDAEKVKRVGGKLTAAVQTYLAGKGQADLIKDYNWEFNLVNNAEVNAWCLPGGKIVVYSGILPLTPSDTDLAVVMGHEIAHAILKHGNERMSQQLLVEFGGQALSVALSSKPAETQELFRNAYGISSNLGLLAYSRKQENEADESGLYIMATGSYNPNAAIGFWQRMLAQSSGSAVPVFLRTHPSEQQRIDNITGLIPKAMAYYKP